MDFLSFLLQTAWVGLHICCGKELSYWVSTKPASTRPDGGNEGFSGIIRTFPADSRIWLLPTWPGDSPPGSWNAVLRPPPACLMGPCSDAAGVDPGSLQFPEPAVLSGVGSQGRHSQAPELLPKATLRPYLVDQTNWGCSAPPWVGLGTALST